MINGKPNVYEARHRGRELCDQTEGSDHYKQNKNIETLDLAISQGIHEDFCICNIIKYAQRFKKTRNIKDLVKVSDYAQILCGVELYNQEAKAREAKKLMDDCRKATAEDEAAAQLGVARGFKTAPKKPADSSIKCHTAESAEAYKDLSCEPVDPRASNEAPEFDHVAKG